MKNLLKTILALCLSLGLFGVNLAKPIEGAELIPEESFNEGKYFYATWRTQPSQSFLYDNGSGVTRVEHNEDHVIIEDYNRNFELVSTKKIADELDTFGGFYHTDKANYLLYGQSNPQHKDTVEVLRMVKYSPDWNRLDQASTSACDTAVPFDAGNVNFAQKGDYLYIHTAHEMYSGHQSNWRLVLDLDQMEFTDNVFEVMNIRTGYVSHSFCQDILVDGDDIVTIDHGDAYPRALTVVRYNGSAGKECFFEPTNHYPDNLEYFTVLSFPSAPSGINPNYTGATLGGMVNCTDGYQIVYTYDESAEDVSQDYSGNDVYAAFMDKESGVSKITKLNTTKQDCSTPFVIAKDENSGYIFWNLCEPFLPGNQLCYVTYNNGSYSPVKTVEAPMSDCEPIFYQGELLWYCTRACCPRFYQLTDSGIVLHDTNPFQKISIAQSDFGTVEIDKEQARAGESVSVSVKALPGFELTGVKVDEDPSATHKTLTKDFNWDIHACSFRLILGNGSVTIRPEYQFKNGASMEFNKLENGLLYISNQQAYPGDTVILHPVANPGYEIDELSIEDRNGEPISYTDNHDGTFSYVVPEASRLTVVIHLSFKKSGESSDSGNGESSNPESSQPSFSPDTNSNTPVILDPYGSFGDVSQSAWYFKGVKYAIDNGIMTGLNPTTFAPSRTTTRAMVVTILYRLEGSPKGYTESYDDVYPGDYYADGCAWAAANGIMTGYGDGRFGPAHEITREQMAAVLYRYAQFKNKDVSARDSLSSYIDAGRISSFARNAMEWTAAKQIITGTTPSTLEPQGSATRAQVATILERYSHS